MEDHQHQPLNMLSGKKNALIMNAAASHHSHQSNQAADNERQVALANLFNSLSSLAAVSGQSRGQQQQQHANQQLSAQQTAATNAPPPSATSSSSSTTPSSSQAQRGSPPSALALSSSLQSVMAAAMMQQQLANAVSQQQQQQQQQQPVGGVPFSIGGCPNERLIGRLEQDAMQLGQQQATPQQPQQQRINYCTICNKELCNKYFMKTHMLKMHGINLEMEQPAESDNNNNNSDANELEDDDGDDEHEHEHEGEANDRRPTNGDESEESERAAGSSPSNEAATNRAWPLSKSNTKSNQVKRRELVAGGSKAPPAKKQSNGASANSNGKTQSTATSVMNGFAGNSMGGVVCDICNKELCSKYFLKVHKQNTHGIMTDYQDPNQFMYPFGGPLAGSAGAFMAPAGPLGPNLAPGVFPASPLSLFGGPAAPVAVPVSVGQLGAGEQLLDAGAQLELVQRTGGLISTGKRGNSKRARLSQPGKQQHYRPGPADIEKAGERREAANEPKQLDAVYRLLLAQQIGATSGPAPGGPSQRPAAELAALGQRPGMESAIPGGSLGALMCFGALGPAGAFGPLAPGAAMSPAMIVDNILRNQHLFNRQSKNHQANQAKTGPSLTDKNNNNSNNGDASKQQTSKLSKDSSQPQGTNSSSNNRYFSHYTEACPMCDRRFKSIKWLKTHMMSDHKQEIGAYMQMMMQYLYASKSQQMAAAATMAAFEQQQQRLAHQQQHLHLAAQHSQHSHIAAAVQQQQPANADNFLGKCFAPQAAFHRQRPSLLLQQPANLCAIDHFKHQADLQQEQQVELAARAVMNRENYSSTVREQFEQQSAQFQADISDYVIDARCARQESWSPANLTREQAHSEAVQSAGGQPSPVVSPSNSASSARSQVNFGMGQADFVPVEQAHLVLGGFNFELARLSPEARKGSKLAKDFITAVQGAEGSDTGDEDSSCSGSERSEGRATTVTANEGAGGGQMNQPVH